ncbi:MAG TPA: ATP-binding cassette domain-containing protein [Vicinamibacteria bacterium]|jgi:ABC-2 type transport system ATP-binding protein|nr:ATP-binding cassette domain-containing protein [Vicinamibacteria bacterium]
MIEVDNLTKRYGRETAVNGISFKVQKGEILGFLGPNGAGKTTTMRILTCFLPPTDGIARVAGFDVFEDPLEVKRRVGYLPETPPLYPDMDVLTFLDFVAKIKGIASTKRKARIDEVVEKCRVGDVGRKLIGKLSKGYRQRVGLAQAIIGSPDVLILDEPTAGLDPKQIIETRELIKSFGGNHTVILSTHILPEVSMTCGRVLIINKGRVVAEDTPENLTHRLRGAGTLRLEVRGASGAIFDALRVVPGVRAIHPRAEAHGGQVFEVEVQPGQDIRGDLARSVVQKGFDLLSLQEVGMSLEEIFLHLTTTDAASESAAEPGAEHQEVTL